MARMIPPRPSQDVKSAAEKKIFRMFETDPECKSFTVLHSLGLASHIKRQYGEIDFVVLAPNEGIFCLEVKGGRVKREGGIWSFTDRFGNTTSKNYSPFNQAREGMFSLLEAIRKAFGTHHRLYNLVFRYGVMFPNIEFTVTDTESEQWEIFDLKNRGPIARYIRRLSANAHKKVAETYWYNPKESRPTDGDIETLVNFLRGDFEKIPPPSVVLEETEESLFRLTDEQYKCLDALENNNRCLFSGGGGTGKTMIAAEYARREAEAGKKVGFFCYNRLLALQIKQNLSSSVPGTNRLTVNNLHKFIRDTVIDSELKTEFLQEEKETDDKILYSEKYPFFGNLAVQSNPNFEAFDTLVIDEAQDLITPDNLDFFDEILAGGLNGGKWAIFADFHRQAIYSNLSGPQMLQCIKERAPYFTDYKLRINCRNTKKIGEETAAISGFNKPPFLASDIEGIPVDYIFYENRDNQINRIESILSKLAYEGIAPRKITVLSPVAIQKSCFDSLLASGKVEVEEISSSFFDPEFNKITFSTIHSFKGLENSVIVLTDVENLTSVSARSLLYVGMSRARQRLYMLLPEKLRSAYNKLNEESLKRLLKH